MDEKNACDLLAGLAEDERTSAGIQAVTEP